MTFSPLNKILFLLTLIFISLSAMNPVYSQECPFGIENCMNGCGRWIDVDGDGICDRSSNLIIQSDSNLVKKDTISDKTLAKVTLNSTTGVKKNLSNQKKPENDIDENLSGNFQTETIEVKAEPEIQKTKSPPRYRMIFYSSLTIGAYLLSLLLMKLNVYKKKIHRRIWNVLLLITFMVSGILGLILVLQINYKILSSYFLQFLQWHVDFGIGMAWISIFHIIWHFTYFKNMFRLKTENKD